MTHSPFFKLFSVLAAFVLLFVEQPLTSAQNITRPQVMKAATSMKGVPYVFGGASPTGFDCSGLVQYVFARASIQLPRTADRQYEYGTPVTVGQARPGDLMFFNTGNHAGEITHVGIYMGNGHMLHAPRPGKAVQFASVNARSWFRPRLLGIRRIGKYTFELARKPRGWETSHVPRFLNLKLPFRDAVQTASL